MKEAELSQVETPGGQKMSCHLCPKSTFLPLQQLRLKFYIKETTKEKQGCLLWSAAVSHNIKAIKGPLQLLLTVCSDASPDNSLKSG